MASSTIDVADDKPEAALFNDLAANPAIGIGDTAAVGTTGEFARIAGGAFQQGGGQNDLLFLLDEVLYGDGVSGVALIALDDDTATLGLTNAAGATDLAVFDDIGGVIEALSLGFANAGNGLREFALFDLAAGDAIVIGGTAAVGTTGEFARIAGDAFQQGGGQNDLLFLMQEVLYGDGVEGVALNTIDDDSIVLELTNAAGGVADTVAFDGVGGVVQALSLGFVDAGNALREFALFDLAEGDAIVVGNTAAVGATGEFAGIVGGAVEPGDLEALFGAVLEGGGVGDVALNTLDDDTVTLELTNAAGVTDTVTFDNAGGYLADIYHG